MALAIADQIRFRFRFRMRMRMRMDLAACFCRCWWGCDRCYRGIFAVQELGPERRVRSAYRLAAQSPGSFGATEPCHRFSNQHWKGNWKLSEPHQQFRRFEQGKTWCLPDWTIEGKWFGHNGVDSVGMPSQGGKSTSVPNSPAASNFKQQPSSTTYTAQRPATSGYHSGSYKQSGTPKSTYTSLGRSTSRK